MTDSTPASAPSPTPAPTSPPAAAVSANLPMAINGGIAGALLGAAIWAVIVIVTDYEVGYVAVLVGFLAGSGVKLGGGTTGKTLQGLAALSAVLGLVVAKYFIFAHFMREAITGEGGESPGWVSMELLGTFPSVLMEIVGPYDILWVAIAVATAYRVPAPASAASE